MFETKGSPGPHGTFILAETKLSKWVVEKKIFPSSLKFFVLEKTTVIIDKNQTPVLT